MKRFKLNKKIFIVLVLFIAIGYAYLTRNLGNLGANLLRKNDWNIYFDNIKVLDGSITPSNPATIDNSKLVINFTTSFNEPGEYYSFYVDVVNDGSIPCMVNYITLNGVPSEYENVVSFTVKNFDTSEIKEHQLLHAKDKIMLLVEVKYNDDIEEDDLLLSDLSLNLSIEVEYIQADETAQEGPVSIYQMMKNNSVMDNIRSEYVDNDNGINYIESGNFTGRNGNGFYEYYKTANDDMPIYYYRGSKNNLVVFGGQCFNILRTTDTGDVKLMYYGAVDSNNVCTNSNYEISSIQNFSQYTYYRPFINISYMYGEIEPSTTSLSFESYQSMSSLYYTNNYNKTGYYSDEVVLDRDGYNLIDPVEYNDETDIHDLIGKYYVSGCWSYGSYACHNTSVMYFVTLASYNSTTGTGQFSIYTLTNRQLPSDFAEAIIYGSSLTDNNDGTYTVSGTTTSMNRSEWITGGYSNIDTGYYTCNNSSGTCSNPRYMYYISRSNYYYTRMNNGILYGNDYEYVDGKYYLIDTTTILNPTTDVSDLYNYHYTCGTTSDNCTSLKYIYSYYIANSNSRTTSYYYLTLNSGQSLDEYINSLFTPTNNSQIKTLVDNWFEAYMLDYLKYIKDTVYCNDRSFPTGVLNVFNPDGGIISDSYYYASYYRRTNNDFILSCPNKRDSFTVNESDIGNGALTYPVGLITMDESTLTTTYSFRKQTHTLTAYLYNTTVSDYTNGYGDLYAAPVIAIDGNLVINGGNGTPANPYTLSLWY